MRLILRGEPEKGSIKLFSSSQPALSNLLKLIILAYPFGSKSSSVALTLKGMPTNTLKIFCPTAERAGNTIKLFTEGVETLSEYCLLNTYGEIEELVEELGFNFDCTTEFKIEDKKTIKLYMSVFKTNQNKIYLYTGGF